MNDFEILDGVLIEYRGTDKVLRIPNGVKTIDTRSFFGCTELETVYLPRGVVEIKNGAFAQCTNLVSFFMADTVQCIGSLVFENCRKLKHIQFSNALWEIGTGAFQDCISLEQIELPDSVERIKGCAFLGCTGLTYVRLPQNLTKIEAATFSSCKSLEKIHFPNSLQIIEDRAFHCCDSLQELRLPESLHEVKHAAFSKCKGLKRVILPRNLCKIKSSAFAQCSALMDIRWPANLSVIETHAFEDCTALKEIVLPDSGLTIANEAFHGCHALQKVTLPRGRIAIQDKAFHACDNLNRIAFQGWVSRNNFDISNYNIEWIEADYIEAVPASLQGLAFRTFLFDGGDTNAPGWLSYQRFFDAKADTVGGMCRTDISFLRLILDRKLVKSKHIDDFLRGFAEAGAEPEAAALLADYRAKEILPTEDAAWQQQRRALQDTVFERMLKRKNQQDITGLRFMRAGRFKTFAGDMEWRQILRERGALPYNQVDPDLDYLVLGEDYADTICYAQAKALGIAMINEDEWNQLCNRQFRIWQGKVLKYFGHEKDVYIPAGVTEIEEYVFAGNKKIEQVIMPDSLKVIKGNAFRECTALQGVQLSSNLEKILSCAFMGCNQLTEITIPDSVIALDSLAFGQCQNLEFIYAHIRLQNTIAITKPFEGCTRAAIFYHDDT